MPKTQSAKSAQSADKESPPSLTGLPADDMLFHTLLREELASDRATTGEINLKESLAFINFRIGSIKEAADLKDGPFSSPETVTQCRAFIIEYLVEIAATTQRIATEILLPSVRSQSAESAKSAVKKPQPRST